MDEEQVAMMQQIEDLREQLSKLASEKGYTHKETINISQQLDRLLNQYNESI